MDDRLNMLTTQFPTKGAAAQTPQEEPGEEGIQIPEEIREAIKSGDNAKLNEMLKGMSLDQVWPLQTSEEKLKETIEFMETPRLTQC